MAFDQKPEHDALPRLTDLHVRTKKAWATQDKCIQISFTMISSFFQYSEFAYYILTEVEILPTEFFPNKLDFDRVPPIADIIHIIATWRAADYGLSW